MRFQFTNENCNIVVRGSGFGDAPAAMPYTGDLNQFYFADFRTHYAAASSLFDAGTAWWGHAARAATTLKYQSWSDREIVIAGFGGPYGRGRYIVRQGDPILIAIWKSSDTSQTGPQTAWGGFAR
ncbi:MAG: hypothetical protein KGJ88_13465 [Verrucomicrobiota bacterium]|nr:hypothetical protein [Verrucomicrobiota bacterium]